MLGAKRLRSGRLRGAGQLGVKDMLKLALIGQVSLHYNAASMKQLAGRCSPTQTKTHPVGWVWDEHFDCHLARLDCRPDAARTQLYFRRLTVLQPRNYLEVRVEAAAGVPLRKADRIAEGRTFTALSALGHE